MDVIYNRKIMVKTKGEVFKIIHDLSHRFYKLGVRRLGIFGSFAREDNNKKSDVDIIVAFEPEFKTFNNYIIVYNLLEGSFGRKIELLPMESISPYFSDTIIKEAEFLEISA
ncbi:MAG: nucleotidyltransferase domain-containing protein [Spirochaetales bacterium]|nr:nucleotidyltransferase domain-containing protein [Spirochaetales bacterium]